MKVFVTGGTGFVGQEILVQLLRAGHTVRALVREGSTAKLDEPGKIDVHPGDITDAASLVGA
ncbi:MAG: NAD-dependent epimerase/dehydratase family protein, partial [Desulfuromonadales bacterium]